MDSVLIASELEQSTYLVHVYLHHEDNEPELISEGSAVAVTPQGHLLTAAHVVTSRLPVRAEDLRDPNVVVVAKTKGGQFEPYVSPACGLTIELRDYLRHPLTVDLAILQPLRPKNGVAHQQVSHTPRPEVGTPVLMSGFPDDMELPFSFDRALNRANPEVREQERNLVVARRLLMVKSGILGHVTGVVLPADGIEGSVMYIDNVLQSGGSGGPVVNEGGEVIGIVTDRAITAVPYEETPNLRVPSGSALAVSPSLFSGPLRDIGA